MKIGIATSTDVDVTWLSSKTLQVSHPGSFALDPVAPFLNGVEIEFVTKEATVARQKGM
jgi:hypothetical protein